MDESHRMVEAIPTFSCPPQPTCSSASFKLDQSVPRTVPYASPPPQLHPTGSTIPSSTQTVPFLNSEKEYDLIQVLYNVKSFFAEVIYFIFFSLLNHAIYVCTVLQELLKLNIEGCVGSGSGISTLSQNSPNTAVLHTRLQDVKSNKGLLPVKVPVKFNAVCDTGTNQCTPSATSLEQQSNQLHAPHQQQLDLSNCWSSMPLHQASTGKFHAKSKSKCVHISLHVFCWHQFRAGMKSAAFDERYVIRRDFIQRYYFFPIRSVKINV